MKSSCRKSVALLLAALLTVLTFSGCSLFKKSSKSVSLSDVSSDMYRADWWVSKTKKSGRVLLSDSDIQALNRSAADSTEAPAVDFSEYSYRLAGSQLRELIHAERLSEERLYNSLGDLINTDFYQSLQESMNPDAIPPEITVRFAILVQNTALRAYPTLSTAYRTNDGSSADVFSAGTLLAGTPVAVLHYDTENNWYFVQSETNVGWVITDSLAMMETSEWNSYISSKKYLVVTGLSVTPEYSTFNGIYGQTFSMGTRLPLCTDEEAAALVNGRSTAGCYVVKFPLRDRFGDSRLTALLIPYSEDVHVGYLPFSRENLLKQSMKYVGRATPSTGTDGALMVQSIFSVFGIRLPSTLSEQSMLHINTTGFEHLNDSERSKALASLPCGTLLFSPEQVAIVLGTVKGRTYVLTTLRDYYVADGRANVNASVIAPLDLTVKRDGSTLGKVLTHADTLLSEKKNPEETSAASSTAAESSSATSSSVSSAASSSAASAASSASEKG